MVKSKRRSEPRLGVEAGAVVSINFLVDTMQTKLNLTRRHHSERFRGEMVAASKRTGVSVTAFALVNAEYLPVAALDQGVWSTYEQAAVSSSVADRALTVIPVARALVAERVGEEIQINIRRAGKVVHLSWPTTRTCELRALLKELLKRSTRNRSGWWSSRSTRVPESRVCHSAFRRR